MVVGSMSHKTYLHALYSCQSPVVDRLVSSIFACHLYSQFSSPGLGLIMEYAFRSFLPLFHLSAYIKCVFILLQVNFYTMEPQSVSTTASAALAGQ
jgi:hypothetical protein